MAEKKIATDDVPDAASESMDAALSWLQGHLPRVAKGERADVVKDGKKLYDYDYATLTDVSEALLPLLSRVGLAWVTRPTLAEVGGSWRLVLQYELRHVSGAKECGVLPLPDRADPQVVGSHITYWRRYALLAVTGLAPGGDDDGQAAKDAAGKGETLDEASGLSLPPQDTDYLLAMLQPDAMTPVADYPAMWQRVVQRRAAAKPSPVEQDGHRLTWAQLFGYSLFRRAEVCTAPDEVMALWNEAQQVGWGKYPWPWAGETFQAHLKARGKQIKQDLENEYKIAELAVTSASTPEQLVVASGLAEALRGRVTEEQMTHLLQVFGEMVERVEKARSTALPEPESDPNLLRASGAVYDTLRGEIWQGGATAELSDALLGATERGEITQEDYAQLLDLLHERAEPQGDRYTWLMWQANEAATEADLDRVRDVAKEAADSGGAWFGEEQRRSVFGSVSARRIQLRGGGYR